MSDYADLSPRQKARIMEENLQRHNERRRALGIEHQPQSVRTPWDRDTDNAPAPTFYRDDQGLVDPDSRLPSWDANRRAVRFRDGLPPPPPPTAPLERAKILREAGEGNVSVPDSLAGSTRTHRPTPALVPQDLFDAAPPPRHPPVPHAISGTFVRDEVRPDPILERAIHGSYAQPESKLSPSQKRRARRQKQRTNTPRPAPFPLPQDSAMQPISVSTHRGTTNGVAETDYYPGQPVQPSHPEIAMSACCDRPITLQLGDLGSAPTTLYCSLKPYPHPGQPHMVRLPSTPDAVEVFLGWFGPGE